MMNVVIFGAPGSGKGTQSILIAEKFGLYHISTGEVLRHEIAEDTELGRMANEYISQGHLIPDKLMLDVLEVVMDLHTDEVSKGVIFDGFPRTIPQAEAFNDLMNRRGTPLTAVVGLEVPTETLVERMLLRGAETGRADDNIETIRERMHVYAEQTEPLRKFYEEQGVYHDINGDGHVTEVFERISLVLEKLKC